MSARPAPTRRSNPPVVTPADVEQGLQSLSPRWSLLLLLALMDSPLSYSDLGRKVTGINKATLSRRLHELEDAGLVTRMTRNTRPVSVVYTLTKKGEAVRLVTDAIEAWLTPRRETRLAG